MKYNELSEEAKQKAINSFRDINLHDEWDQHILDNEKEKLEDMGLSDVEIKYEQGDSCSFSGKISDIQLFLEKINVNDGLQFPKSVRYHNNDVEDDGFFQQIEDWKSDYCDELFKAFEEEYEFQTSDEQVEESIIANDYDFDEDGSLS